MRVSGNHKGLVAFQEFINEKLGEKYVVEVYPSEILETFSKNYGIFNLPYLFSSAEAYHAAMEDNTLTDPIFLATEGSAIAVVYALILGSCKNITLKGLWQIIILLIMNVILLISDTFMDVTSAILIFTPLFLPIVKTFGMNPVHFVLILVYNLCIGNITPPVGNTLFVAIKVGKTPLGKVMPYMLIFYAFILLGLMAVTYIPAVSIGLPMAMGIM